ncbi:hypothetical protein CANARDRAFT_214303 [[Candida] arabinofermentans NRRL YB-2248]|uniref:Cytochrome b-c1 complex subunit 2, mitochondrial n=1 Tax=[Candida] arabinofermentans NRRL YB-2248 TaxID=983967 RepID=A0A1E4SVR7_9ASCO|nr:hypothetical protein CANARDRAFT_214303 [[Candida] arabinofermentans NRRL YB-2248]
MFFKRSFSTSIPKSIKIVSKEGTSNEISTLKIKVKNAGSKTGSNGLSHLLSSSNFLSTSNKSGLRLKRESELLGGSYNSILTRDDIILESSFLKENLPFFINSLSDVLSKPSFKKHEFNEITKPYVLNYYETLKNDSKFNALEELHSISFRKGLGNSLYYSGLKSISIDDISSFAKSIYIQSNIEIETTNIIESDLNNFIKNSSLNELPIESSIKLTEQKSYNGLESRIPKSGLTTVLFGKPIENKDFKTYSLLSSFLKTKFESEFGIIIDTKVLKYDSKSLFYFSTTGSNIEKLNSIIKSALNESKKVKNLTSFDKLSQFELSESGLSDLISIKGEDKVDLSKYNFVVVGDVDSVLYSDEL